MKTKPTSATLQSLSGTKQTFIYTPVTPELVERLSTSFELGSVTSRGLRLATTRYHFTSVFDPQAVGKIGSGDTLHIEFSVRHHPNIDQTRFESLLGKFLAEMTKSKIINEVLTPGVA